MSEIKKNLENIETVIRAACQRSERQRAEVALVAVSKGQSAETIMEAYQCGQRAFGENRVQELLTKLDALPADIEWHLIGHLQRNKVKYIIGKVALIHSVDSLRLAEEIDKEAEKRGICQEILLEVNVAGEEAKHGVAPAEAGELAKAVAALPHIRLKGLMTVAPYVEDDEENRRHFASLQQLLVDIKGKNVDNKHISDFKELSMGMSGDYRVAVEEGATMIRIGTVLFKKG
jgi:pyridoxal phosphate enzyme (YggS family)